MLQAFDAIDRPVGLDGSGQMVLEEISVAAHFRSNARYAAIRALHPLADPVTASVSRSWPVLDHGLGPSCKVR